MLSIQKTASSVLALALLAAAAASVAAAKPPANANDYGTYCANQSKTHLAGQKRTPFSQCVTAMATLASGATAAPREACKAMSRKHAKGESGTPFSRCISAGAKLLHDQQTDSPTGSG